MIQSYQDTINSTRDLFSSSISLQINETMRVLTVFSAIVLPLSLLIGVLGLQGFDLNNLTHYKISRPIGNSDVSHNNSIVICILEKKWIFSHDKEIKNNKNNKK